MEKTCELTTGRLHSDRSHNNRAPRGGLDTFENLIGPYLPSLSRFARMRARNESEAEDVVQEAILRAFTRLDQFRGEASLKTWLCAIAFNEVKHPDPIASPEAQLQHSQEIERLRRTVRSLPEKYRLMIELRDLQGLSIIQTAESLSISIAAVKTRHFRARAILLRSLLEQQGAATTVNIVKRFPRGSPQRGLRQTPLGSARSA